MPLRVIRTVGIGILLLGIAGAAGLFTVRAQGQEILPALLTEVRGLRAAMEQMASAGPRVQLALARLQLQEQRVNTLVRRLDETRTKLANAQRELVQHEEQFKRFESAIKEGSPEARQEAEQLEHMLAMFKRQFAQAQADVQRLTAEESGLMTDIAAEQGRWTEINQRLEELERTLERR
jgi:predicted  nucleic acid-binding Zn-ribbon protein